MEIIVYLSLAFVLLQLINVSINFIFRQSISSSRSTATDRVSILIPARNEEHNIALLLGDLSEMKEGDLEIWVCDDWSTDRTAEVVRACATRDSRIRLLDSRALPHDWLGKNHACYQLAEQAQGDYLLFLDADVRLSGRVIYDAVAYMKRCRVGLLSIFPRQVQITLGEKCTVPLMNYILLTLLPLVFVRISPFKSHAAANGQFMLFDTRHYRALDPHQRWRGSVVEDIVISRYFKREKVGVACLTGEPRIACRMYRSYAEALDGFSKNIFMFFGGVPLFAFLFWAGAALGGLPFLFKPLGWGLSYVVIVLLIQFLYARTTRQKVGMTCLLFPVHLFFMLQVMIRAIIARKKKKYAWKGREIY